MIPSISISEPACRLAVVAMHEVQGVVRKIEHIGMDASEIQAEESSTLMTMSALHAWREALVRSNSQTHGIAAEPTISTILVSSTDKTPAGMIAANSTSSKRNRMLISRFPVMCSLNGHSASVVVCTGSNVMVV